MRAWSLLGIVSAVTAAAATAGGGDAGDCREAGARLRSDIFWAAPFYSGGGYCSEAHDAAAGLAGCGVALRVLQHGDSFNQQFVQRLGTDRLRALQARTVSSLPGRATAGGGGGGRPAICVCHSEPGAWSVPRPHYHTADCPAAGCTYTIGRTMFETDRLPTGWAARLNAVDELWVPTEFQRRIFAAHGVARGKLHVVGEAVDASFFDPAAAVPLEIPPRLLRQPAASSPRGAPPVTSDTVVLLSVFKWEPRKAPELLINAFCAEFTASDDVLLVLLTNAYHTDSAHGDRVASQRRAAAEAVGRPLESLPRIVVLDENVPQADMPRLYKRADGFVLPSRGEGWGRPHMEALAMGLPVIATNWSGPTEFLHSGNSYPLPVADRLVPVPDGPFRGHLWAEPSAPDLRRLMRRVYDGTRGCRGLPPTTSTASAIAGVGTGEASAAALLCAELTSIRETARADVLRLWTPNALTARMLTRLTAIDAVLHADDAAREADPGADGRRVAGEARRRSEL